MGGCKYIITYRLPRPSDISTKTKTKNSVWMAVCRGHGKICADSEETLVLFNSNVITLPESDVSKGSM